MFDSFKPDYHDKKCFITKVKLTNLILFILNVALRRNNKWKYNKSKIQKKSTTILNVYHAFRQHQYE